MLEKQEEVRFRIKNDPFKTPVRHVQDVYGMTKEQAKVHLVSYIRKPTRWGH